MRSLLSRFAVVIVTLTAVSESVSAQKATASAQIVTQVPQQGQVTVCNQQDGPSLSASTTCGPQAVKGGQAGATASADLLGRTTTAGVAMVDKGNPGITAYAEAESRVTAKIAVTGPTNPGDYIVLHFLAVLDYQFGGRPADVFSALVTAAHGEGDTGASFITESHFGNNGNASSSHGAKKATGGFDLLLALDNFTGTYKYTYGAGIQMTIDNTLNSLGYAQFALLLASIDAYNTNDEYLASVDFNENGTETLDLTPADVPTSAPEPASFVLIATGLLGIAGYARRKRLGKL